jgi:peptidoglycan/xylan/chitin deacetylase (PgdA/CDA1 family)
VLSLAALSGPVAVPAGAGPGDGADGKAPQGAAPDLLRAGLSQAGESLIATIRTARTVPLRGLDPLPDTGAAGSAYLCLELQRQRAGGSRRLCLGGAAAHRRVGLELVNGRGWTTKRKTLVARVKRSGSRKLVLTLLPGAAGLSPNRYDWRVLESRGSHCGRSSPQCGEALPARGSRRFRLRPVRAVGCTGAASVLDTNGSRDRKVVALTFDDGPSEYTPAFLDVLREKHIDGTFFEIGQEMPGREETMRRILREGSEIGNHTMHHAVLPGYSELAEASSLTESSTYFKPCLFRPPDGVVDSTVISNAAALGMRTITWDVDPSDWMNPGSAAVYSRVVEAAQPGSIVLMHDGGGNRSGTLAALPAIIDTLRARGYRFATVSELLGKRLIYRPYG